MNATTYGLDVAKQVFQMYWVDTQTGEIANRRFRRDELIEFLAQRPAGRVALEACGSAHWWARKIKALGHEVVLLHAKFIRPFVQTNKTDAADAQAIWTAVHQPGMRTVAAKTEDQQTMLALHRMRSLLIKFRTMQVNQLRGLLYEFGVSFRTGRVAGLTETQTLTRHEEATRIHPSRPEPGNRADRTAVEDAFNTWPTVCTHSLNGLTRPARSRLSFDTTWIQTVKDRLKPDIKTTTSVNSQRYDISIWPRHFM